MSLKKPTGDMYDFIDWIWNPISGKCSHNCSYCYVPRIAGRFKLNQREPHIVEHEFRTNLKSGIFIFICDNCDLFAADIPDCWIERVVKRCRNYPGNRYLFQTKNPQRLVSSSFGLSVVSDEICTTLETNRWVPEVMRNAPPPSLRAQSLAMLAAKGFTTMVTVEPVMDFDLDKMLRLIRMTKAAQVNIGAKTGGHKGFPEPPAEKVRELITELNTFTRVVEKNNLRRLLA
jgi:DNA repair photolyase